MSHDRPASDKAPARFMVIGSINMDTLLHTRHPPTDDGAVLVTHSSRMPGGHAANCASALHALGATVALVGAVGDDDDGRALVDELRGRGIDTGDVQVLAEHPTGEVLIPTCGTDHVMLVLRHANDHTDVDLAAAIGRFAPDVLVVFDPSAALFRQIGMLDHAPRPTPRVAWIPGGINAGEARLGFMLDVADTVIVNAVERAALLGYAPPDVVADGRRELVTTTGAGGARWQCGDQDIVMAASPAAVTDSVGAGDAFAAAYLLARHAGVEPARRLEIANAAGGVAVRTRGARAAGQALGTLWTAVMGQAAPRAAPADIALTGRRGHG